MQGQEIMVKQSGNGQCAIKLILELPITFSKGDTTKSVFAEWKSGAQTKNFLAHSQDPKYNQGMEKCIFIVDEKKCFHSLLVRVINIFWSQAATALPRKTNKFG